MSNIIDEERSTKLSLAEKNEILKKTIITPLDSRSLKNDILISIDTSAYLIILRWR